jgi:hypothetical protein
MQQLRSFRDHFDEMSPSSISPTDEKDAKLPPTTGRTQTTLFYYIVWERKRGELETSTVWPNLNCYIFLCKIRLALLGGSSAAPDLMEV